MNRGDATGPTLAEWPHLFRPGEAGHPVLLMLHGTGDTETGIAPLAEHLDGGAGVLAPRGRVSEGGATRWFRRLSEGVFDVDDVIVRAGELAGFIRDARAEYGIQDAPLVAVGFSNGANIALATALLHPDVLDRVVALSGMYPFAERDPLGDVSAVSALLVNGDSDPMAPAVSVTRLAAVAEQHGATILRSTRAGGHGVSAGDVAAAKEWLAQHAG
jgi:phospholipase/carboxylesterase